MDRTLLQDEINAALRAHDKPRLSILRLVLGEVKTIEVDERRDVSETDVDACLKRVLKQTCETLEGSIKAANDDERTELLTQQVAILKDYLPQQLEGSALELLIDQVLVQTGANTKRDMGKAMGALTQQTGGNFDKPAAAAYLGSKLTFA